MIDKKFIESLNIEDWEVETDEGWQDIQAIHKTVPYTVWTVITKNNLQIKCADTHIVFNERYEEVFVKDLKIGDLIITKDGPSQVVVIKEDKDNPAENMYDLELSAESNHRFFSNGILSHNTTNLAIRTDLCLSILPGIKIAAIVPRSEQLKTIADKYKEVENANRFKCTAPNIRSNLFFREVPHPSGKLSQLRLWYILTNADKIRGNTYDWIDFDEYQDFDDSLETEILATQSRTKIPMITYGGTSKSVDTALENKWLNSARGMWRLTCPHCHHDNYPTLKYHVMDMIRPRGLCCVKCGRKLNVREGQWDFEDTNALALGRWGFHVPQIIVPANTENDAKWLRIYSSAQDKNNFKGFCEEYLGEATEEGSKELSVNDLQRICVLGDMRTLQRNVFDALKSNKKVYTHIISGCDWGGSDDNPAAKTKVSYTAHVIIGLKPNGQYDILDMTRYSGMAWDNVSASIAKRHKEFGGFAIGCDRGVGEVYINYLRQNWNPFKVISYKYAGPGSKLLSIPANSAFPNMYILNRTESISALYAEIKEGRIRAPQWEQCKSALSDMLNLTRVPTESRSGETTFLYNRKSNKSDDFLHALNFALITAKLVQGQPLFNDARAQAIFMNNLTGGQYAQEISMNRYGTSYSG